MCNLGIAISKLWKGSSRFPLKNRKLLGGSYLFTNNCSFTQHNIHVQQQYIEQR
jgi:hypothetical protein